MKTLIVLVLLLLLAIWTAPLRFGFGKWLFPEEYAQWDFTKNRHIATTGWPASEKDDCWAAPYRHLAIKTPGHETKEFRHVVGYIFVSRKDDLVRSVDVDVYYQQFDTALAIARQWSKEYGVQGSHESLDEFEREIKGGARQATWRGRGGGIELSLSGASSATLWYFGVTFILDDSGAISSEAHRDVK